MALKTQEKIAGLHAIKDLVHGVEETVCAAPKKMVGMIHQMDVTVLLEELQVTYVF